MASSDTLFGMQQSIEVKEVQYSVWYVVVIKKCTLLSVILIYGESRIGQNDRISLLRMFKRLEECWLCMVAPTADWQSAYHTC